MIDGIDGSGKSTVINAWKEYLTAQSNAIFDLKGYWQANHEYPPLSELRSYDFIFSCEPTYAGVGKVIREELIKNGNNYPPQAIAEAYSLDRLVLYKKILIPLLEDKKFIIEDRGVSTSLAYQKTQGLEYDFLTELPGNKLALENRPDHLVLMKISAEAALNRLRSRLEKDDNAVFEKSEFLKKSTEIYQSAEYQKLFTDRGSLIDYLNAEVEIDIMKQEAVNLLKSFLI
jgi:thymidylate kinase